MSPGIHTVYKSVNKRVRHGKQANHSHSAPGFRAHDPGSKHSRNRQHGQEDRRGSPHVDKKSMEQFEIRTHKRLLDIINPSNRTVEELKKLNLPAGVDIIIKI